VEHAQGFPRVDLARLPERYQGLPGDIYTKINFCIALDDLSGRYDTVNCRWTPVLPGEAPRYVMLGAQVRMGGGVRLEQPNCNCKILKNATAANAGGPGHYEINVPVSGVNGPLGGWPGAAAMQSSMAILANPGDYFEVWAMVSAWQTGNAPLGFGFFPGAVYVDPHYGHTWFWGLMQDDSDLAPMIARVGAAEAALATQEKAIADLQNNVANLQTSVTRL
jgi:hypothetical protein